MELVLASSNTGKIQEFKEILAPLNVQIHLQSALGVSDADETGVTFVENALIKARHAASLTGLPAIADDSGLIVDALGGRPGVLSARYAPDNAARIDKLLQALASVGDQQRTARFYCMTVFIRSADDPAPLLCQGEWHGSILKQAIGRHGFGYDPIFYVAEHQCSAAELSPAVKNSISHRGQALRQLKQVLSNV